jgi:ribonucleoside-diphosphate reductase alpha chain
VNVGKAGDETYCLSETIGMLASIALEHEGPDRLIEKLKDLGSSRSGAVPTLPQAVAEVLTDHLTGEQPEERAEANRLVGDLCPECGQATLIREEGCMKCHTCGFSEC